MLMTVSLALTALSAQVEVTSTASSAEAGAADKNIAQFGIIVGYNGSPTGKKPLRFADDDAFRAYELLARLIPKGRIRLLTRADLQSERRFDYLKGAANLPSRDNLETTVKDVARQVQAAKANGQRTEVYIFYSGHGELIDGYASLSFADGMMSNLGFEDKVLKPLAADRIHLVIDSCNAGALLAFRGDDDGPRPRRVRRVKRQTRSLQAFFQRLPHVGVVFSTSQAEKSYEDVRYESGIFSHVVRSALMGGADVNGDQRVSYRELRGFLAAAFEAVRPAIYRPNALVHAPFQAKDPAAERTERVVSLTRAPVVALDKSVAGHVFLQDDRRLRVAELQKPEGFDVRLIFPKAGPRLYALMRIQPQQGLTQYLRWPLGEGETTTQLLTVPSPELVSLDEDGRGGEAPRRFDGMFEAAFTPDRVEALAPVDLEEALPPPSWLWALSVSGGLEEAHLTGLDPVGDVEVGVRVTRDRFSIGLRVLAAFGRGEVVGDEYQFFRLGGALNPRYLVPLFSVGDGLMGIELGVVGGVAFERQTDVRSLSVGPSGTVEETNESFDGISYQIAGQLSWLWIISPRLEASLDFEPGVRTVDLRDEGLTFRRVFGGRLALYWVL